MSKNHQGKKSKSFPSPGLQEHSWIYGKMYKWLQQIYKTYWQKSIVNFYCLTNYKPHGPSLKFMASFEAQLNFAFLET